MCITITVGERSRKLMGFFTTIINCIILFLSIALFVAGVGIRARIDRRVEIMNDYDPGALPYYLMVTAVLLFAGHLLAVWFCHSAIYVETRSDQHHYFVSVILCVIVLSVLVLVSIIVLAVHASFIKDALEDGIRNAMKAYKSDLDSKIRVDHLQLQFECCGVHSYKDWFKISWVNTMYVNVLSPEVKPYLVDGEFIKDDVPFSCCSRQAKRACVHHSVGRFSQHEGISGSTLNHQGCAPSIHSLFYKTLLAPTMWLLFIVLILQVVDVVIMRLLQTSIFTADEMNDPEGATEAYCIKGLGGGGDTRDLFRRKKSIKRDAEKGGYDGDEDDEDEPRGNKGWFSKLKKKFRRRDEDDDDKPRKKKGLFSKSKKRRGDDDDEDDDEKDDDKPKSRKKGLKGLFSRSKKDKEGGDDDYEKKRKKRDKTTDSKRKKKNDEKSKKSKKKEEKKKKKPKKKEDKKRKTLKKKAERKKNQAKKTEVKKKKAAAKKAKSVGKTEKKTKKKPKKKKSKTAKKRK